MAKPKIPNIKKSYKELDVRLSKYMAKVEGLYSDLAKKASSLAVVTAHTGESPFSFSSYPQINRRASDMMREYANSMQGLIMSGTSDEWKRSNELQDQIAKKAIKFYDARVNGEKERVYFQANSEALKAFQERATRGMNLSERIWDLTDDTQRELECAISAAIEKGMSAVTLSKRVSKYLNDFDELKKDYGEKYGNAENLSDCEYRSLRLARSEINMAYRKAENERWQDFDFILGFEVKTSDAHPTDDICNELAGQYPKDFVFLGWHPNCMCYAVPIVMGEDEYWAMEDGEEKEGEVEELPDGFKDWVLRNEGTIEGAEERGTLPYFLSDNWAAVKDITTNSVVRELVERAGGFAGEMGALTTDIAEEFMGYTSGVSVKTFSEVLTEAQELKVTGGTPYDITDFMTTTVVVEKKEIEGVLSRMKELKEFEALEEMKPKDYLGFSGSRVMLKKDGITAEVNVTTEKMVYASQRKTSAVKILGKTRWEEIKRETGKMGGLGKRYYDEIRRTVPGTKEWLRAVEKSKRYYAHFS